MNTKQRTKVILVGANHAGTSFARTLRQLSQDIELIVYEKNNNTSFLGCGIALWVSGEFQDPDGLFYSNPDELKEAGCGVHIMHEVTDINTDKKTVRVKNLTTGEIFSDNYDKLVFAGGTWPIVPPFKGVNYNNILISKIFQHAQNIKAKAEEKDIKKVAVIGAGYIGIELAEAFNKHGKEVTLIDLEKRVVPRYFDKEFTNRMEKNIVEMGVNLHLGEKVLEFISKNGKDVSAVKTDKGTYETDLVILSVGFRPNTEALAGYDKLPNGSIKVDSYQHALKKGVADEDVYIIGDSAAMMHKSSNEHQHVALATNAVKTGLVAAFNVAGQKLAFPGVAGTNAISVFGCHYASTGLTETLAKKQGLKALTTPFFVDNDRPEFMRETGKVGIKIVYEEKTYRILGAQVGSWSKQIHTEVIYMFALAIQKGLSILELALMDYYFLPHLNKPFNFIITPIVNALGLQY